MRKFYEIFNNEKLNPAGSKLTWSHYRELLVVKNIDAINYYINVCDKNNLTKKQLQEKIKMREYDRLSNDVKNKLIKKEYLKIDDLIPNPIIIKVKDNNEKLNEYALKQAILNR